MDLSPIQQDFYHYFKDLAVESKPYGSYRGQLNGEADFYASLDIALMRVIMGEDFERSLSAQERQEWIDYINGFATSDGSYQQFNGHSALHANGMVIGALGPLGGQQAYPVSLYDAFSDPTRIAAWLEDIDWSRQWSASHLFWGGMHCFSMHKDCTCDWKERVFQWLDAELDPTTGWWRKGVAHSDRHQPLGGSVHILPMYQHHQRAFPYPRALIDSTLSLQLENGFWLAGAEHGISYLELDALYVLAFVRAYDPEYKIAARTAAIQKYADYVEAWWQHHGIHYFYNKHAHHALAFIGILGLLNQLVPDRFPQAEQAPAWTDIFSDQRLYRTDLVNRDPQVTV